MRYVVDAPMVAHLWAHQSQDSARNGRNFYFEGKDIYSYGSHFRCASVEANQQGQKAYLVTTRTYSNTTCKHMGMVRKAIPYGELIFYTPYSLNAVTPNIGTGFDLGVEVHGLLADKFGYEVGLFNGTGISVNTAGKTFSDDWHIPSLLYAGRFTYMPKGVMPSTQGNPNRLNEDKLMLGVSTSLNVESENESTNDYRAGLEFAMLKRKLYLGAEMYYMHVGFTKRQKIDQGYHFLGGYVQGGYFVTSRLQATARYDFFNRNGMDTNGFMNMPAVGVNYFFKGCNLKLQAMYQFVGRWGHDTQLDRDNDDLGIATHNATVMLQYTF